MKDSQTKPTATESTQEEFSILRLFLTGFAMGAADVVPGVSGGTVAFITGIYQRLIDAIHTSASTVLKLVLQGKIKEAVAAFPARFVLPLGVGVMTAVLSLASVLETVLENHPVELWSLFFGLVAASIVIVGRSITRWRWQQVVALCVATVATFFLTGLVAAQTPATLPAFFLAGAVAVCAMILPGLSGSFLLVVFGKYRQILTAVDDRNILVLGVFMLGAVVGLATFARLLSFLFKRYEQVVLAALLGCMIGALRKVWPWKETVTTYIDSHGLEQPLSQLNILPVFTETLTFVAIALMLISFGFVLGVEWYAGRKKAR